MNYYKLNHGTYPGTTHVYFNCTGEEVIKHYNSKRSNKNIIDDNAKERLLETKGGGLTIHRNGTCIIFMPKFQNKSNWYSILTHELLHVTFLILGYVGVLYDLDNHEAFTYFIDYLTEHLYSKTFKEQYPDI